MHQLAQGVTHSEGTFSSTGASPFCCHYYSQAVPSLPSKSHSPLTTISLSTTSSPHICPGHMHKFLESHLQRYALQHLFCYSLILNHAVIDLVTNLPYFSDYKMHIFPPNLGGKWGCVFWSKCSLPGSRGVRWGGVEWGFISCFPPLKPRYILWSGASYSPKTTVTMRTIGPYFKILNLTGEKINNNFWTSILFEFLPCPQ